MIYYALWKSISKGNPLGCFFQLELAYCVLMEAKFFCRERRDEGICCNTGSCTQPFNIPFLFFCTFFIASKKSQITKSNLTSNWHTMTWSIRSFPLIEKKSRLYPVVELPLVWKYPTQTLHVDGNRSEYLLRLRSPIPIYFPLLLKIRRILSKFRSMQQELPAEGLDHIGRLTIDGKIFVSEYEL